MLRLFKPNLNESGERLVDRLLATDLGGLIASRSGEDGRTIYVDTWCEAEIFRKSSPSRALRWLRKRAVVDALTNRANSSVSSYNKRHAELYRYIKRIVSKRLVPVPGECAFDSRQRSSLDSAVEAFVSGLLIRELDIASLKQLSDVELDLYFSGHLVVGWHGQPLDSVELAIDGGKFVVI